ncbi:MAG: DUF167 domain-containing protein [Candidatus Omnitrophica bacterium]|nr:DUF167 domain-containing protein [Candidatus Omnitrophota bacterium]MCM8816967.1 DUF167 domain-containing protein [Candidatus Omnitrophota bacterium]
MLKKEGQVRISVRVKPYSKKCEIMLVKDGEFIAYVNQPPSEGKANTALIELISDYFNVPRSAIKIVSGYKSRNKIVEIIK